MLITGKINIADSLTNNNPEMHRLINCSMAALIYDASSHRQYGKKAHSENKLK